MEIVIIVVVVVLFAIAVLVLLYERSDQKGYRLEVEPMNWALVKNLWNGEVRGLPAGSHTLRVGKDKVQGLVSLRNETRNIEAMKASTSDRVDVFMDLVVQEQRVLDNEQAVRRAWLEINYSDRNKLIDILIAAGLQNALIVRKLDVIYDGAPGDEDVETVNKDALLEIEGEINQYLAVEAGKWGFLVKVEVENPILPQRLQEVAEEAQAAQKEGEATRLRAEAAGVSTQTAYIGEVIVDALEALGGHRKKGHKR